MREPEAVPPGVDPTRPSAGRLYDYYLGGTEHLEIDRIAAERIRARMPELEDGAWANRGFLQRSARWMAAEAGIRQFIDIGAGLPTRNNTHEAVQSVALDAHTVYVDNDPMVLAHARSLLEGADNTGFIAGDFRAPDDVRRPGGPGADRLRQAGRPDADRRRPLRLRRQRPVGPHQALSRRPRARQPSLPVPHHR